MDKLPFARWCRALFFLFPLCLLLYLPASPQSPYAALFACGITIVVLMAVAPLSARLPDGLRRTLSLLLALPPLLLSLCRAALFIKNTAFSSYPVLLIAFVLLLCTFLLARLGFSSCAMWAVPVAWAAGLVLVLSFLLTLGQTHFSYFAALSAEVLPEMAAPLGWLLPACLSAALALPPARLRDARLGLLCGACLLTLLSLRTLLTLGSHTAALLPYPAFSAAGLASLGEVARQGEVFFAMPLLVCEIGVDAALLSQVLSPFAKYQSKLLCKQNS